MLKVLIVDDEPFVRQGLRALIHWESYGFTLCGEASDGEEAVDMIRKLSPHLVITDIKMPVVDGLELIRRVVSEKGSKVKFVILSGYNDFKYAQTAIKYNVKEYILKPIDEEELVEILGRVKQEVEETIRKEREHGVSIRALAGETIKKLIHGDNSPEVIKHSKQWLNIKDRDNLWYILIEIDHFEQWLNDCDSEEILKEGKRIESALIRTAGRGNALNVYQEHVYRYGIVVNEGILDRFSNNIRKLSSALHENLIQDIHCPITVYVGEKVQTAHLLKDSYRACTETIKYNFLSQKKGVVYYDEMKSTSFKYNLKEIKSYHILLEQIENNDCENIEGSIHEIFIEIEKNFVAPEMIKAYFTNFQLEVAGIVSDLNGDDDFVERYGSFSMDVSRLDQLKERITEFCIKSAQYICNLKGKHSAGVIYDVEKYIKRNYKNDISLKSIAEAFYINPVYLGQLFKRSIGVYFNDYLHNLRVEEAKQLLRRTDLKIYEVAGKVGYTDPDYFISKFEKITKMTPSQYKKFPV